MATDDGDSQSDGDAPPEGEGGTEAGIGTFVGRVIGRLDPVDAAWVRSTSDAVQSLRDALGHEHERLAFLESALGPATVTPAGPTASAVAAMLRAVLEIRGEQLVDDLLAAGVLPAPPATAGVALGPEGAWHLELLASGGGTIARADVLLVADPEALRAHLAARPTTNVVYTTTDAAEALRAGGGEPGVAVVAPGETWPGGALVEVVVVDVGVGIDALDAAAEVVSSRGADAPPSRASAAPLLDAVPLLALALAGASAAVDAATGTEDAADIRARTWARTRDVVTSAGLSHVVTTVTGAALLRIPVAMTTSLGRAAVRDARADVERSRRRVARARRLIRAAG